MRARRQISAEARFSAGRIRVIAGEKNGPASARHVQNKSKSLFASLKPLSLPLQPAPFPAYSAVHHQQRPVTDAPCVPGKAAGGAPHRRFGRCIRPVIPYISAVCRRETGPPAWCQYALIPEPRQNI